MRTKVKVTKEYSRFYLVLSVIGRNLENGFLTISVGNFQRILFM